MRVLAHVGYSVQFTHLLAYIQCNYDGITFADKILDIDACNIADTFDVVIVDTDFIDDTGITILKKAFPLHKKLLIVTNSVCNSVILRLEVGWNVENGVDTEFRMQCAKNARHIYDKHLADQTLRVSSPSATVLPYSLFTVTPMSSVSVCDSLVDRVVRVIYRASQMFPQNYIAVRINNGQLSGLSTSYVSLAHAVTSAMTCDIRVPCDTYVCVNSSVCYETGYYLMSMNVAGVVICPCYSTTQDGADIDKSTISASNLFPSIQSSSITSGHTVVPKSDSLATPCNANVLCCANIDIKMVSSIAKRAYMYATLHFGIVCAEFSHSVCVVSNTALVSSCPPLSNIEDSVRYVTGKSTDWVVSTSDNDLLEPTFSCATEHARQQSRAKIICNMGIITKRKILHQTKCPLLVLVTDSHLLSDECVRIASENRIFGILYCRSRNNGTPIANHKNVLRACLHFNICLVEL